MAKGSGERTNEVVEAEDSVQYQPMTIKGFKNSATILIAICLINIVVYINLLVETLKTNRNVEPNLILVLLLLGAILIELVGLIGILCRSPLLILLYGISMILALISMFYLLEQHVGAIIITIANVVSIWRCYYVLTRSQKNLTSTGWRDSTIRARDRV